MFDTFFGLPLHPFIVHATEVIVPAAAVLVLLTALWPRARRWAGYLPLALALVALVLVPVSTESGEKLEHRVGENDLIEQHAELADGLLPWVIGLVVVAGLLLAVTLYEKRAARAQAAAGSVAGSAAGSAAGSTAGPAAGSAVSAAGPAAVSAAGEAAVPAGRRVPRWMAVVLIVLALVAAGGTVVQAVLIGHSGATAVWQEDMGGAVPPTDDD